MFLFSRAITLSGSPRQALPWVAQMTEYVNANSSLDVSAWTVDFGAPLGTVAWTAVIEDQATLAEAAWGLAGQDGYMDLIEAAADLVAAPGEDSLAGLVHGSPSEPPSVGSVALSTTAHAVVDRIADTLAWSVEIAEYVEGVTGSPVSVWSSTYGQMGQIAFISVLPDVAALDANQAKTNGDPGYLERLSKSAGLWLDGSGHVARYTRIA
jgi:hypothetical protein